MDKKFLTVLIALTLFVTASVSDVFAHGEAGDQPFLKNMTTAFYDVSISPRKLRLVNP